MGTLCPVCPKYFIDHHGWVGTSCLVCPNYFISTKAASGCGQCVLSVRNILLTAMVGSGDIVSCLSEIFYFDQCSFWLGTIPTYLGWGASCLSEIFYCRHIWGGGHHVCPKYFIANTSGAERAGSWPRKDTYSSQICCSHFVAHRENAQIHLC